MMRDEAVQRVQRLLGFRSDKQSEIITEMQAAQIELERWPTLPWFLATEVAFKDTVAGEERVRLPTNFLREVDNDALWYYDGTATDEDLVWTPLIKDVTETLRGDLPGSGAPKAYYLDAEYFRIFPTPDAAYRLKMIYIKQDDTLATNIENKWLKYAPELLIGLAGQRLAAMMRDTVAAQHFQVMEERGRIAVNRDTHARRDANYRYVMGGPD